MKNNPHSDGIETNKKATQQLDESLTELTMVLRAMGVSELNFDEEQHFHLIDEEAKLDAASLAAFSTSVRQMYNAIVKKAH